MIFVRALNEALHRVLENDPRTVVLGEDISDPYGGAFKVSRGLTTAFPNRVKTTPVSEQAIAGLSAGLALGGYRPIAEIMFGDFLALCFDQILNHITKYNAMYAGQVAESGICDDVLSRPNHPYTMGLCNAFPDLARSQGKLVPIEGAPPSLIDPPDGCRFAPRCPFAIERCHEPPALLQTRPGHRAACWRSDEATSLRNLAGQTETWEQVGAAVA